jgi:phospholipid transport system substrate-binding protein
MIRKILFSVLVLGLIFLCSTQTRAAAGADEGATAQVKAVLEKAMDIQTRPDLQGDSNRKERSKLIRQLIGENFLSGDMARESLGGNWEKLSSKQRTEFQDLFTRLFQDSYTRMVLNFLQKENIEYRGQSEQGKGARVQTVIMRANEHIPVNYDLVQKGGRWSIRDVEIDGVSIVENYRNTFQRVIQKESAEGLLKKLRVQSHAIRDASSSDSSTSDK